MNRKMDCPECGQPEVPVTVTDTMGNHYPSPKVTHSPVRYCKKSGDPLTQEQLKEVNEKASVAV
jgi:hypothetical protein